MNAVLAAPRVESVHEWVIPAYNREAFEDRIEQANRRLARAGLDARFEVDYEEFQVARNDSPRLPDGSHLDPHAWYYQTWVRARLVGPLSISAGHYSFVASLVPEEGGMVVRTAPGVELGGYEPRGDDACEHCGTQRNRVRLYLVRDNRDGRIIQVGHNCIEAYTGVSPKGLWALQIDDELRRFAADDEDDWFGSKDGLRRGWLGAPVDRVLALAWVHSDEGRNYVPRSMSHERTPTADLVVRSLFDNPYVIRDPKQRDHFLQIQARAAEVQNDRELIEAIKASAETLNPSSDYGRNMRVLVAGQHVGFRNIGMLASLVRVYARQREDEAARRANPVAAGFIGEPGQRLRDLELQLTTVRHLDGRYGVSTLLVGRTPDGHVVKWFASGAWDYRPGDTLHLAAATVKAHENYQGVDQTVITRGKVDRSRSRAAGRD